MLDQSFWKKYFRAYDILNKAFPYQEVLSQIIKRADIKKGETVFDAGSGTGNLSILAKKAGAVVKSFDFSEAGVSIHKEKDRTADAMVGDLTKPLPFKDNSFNKIISNNVIYTLKKEARPAVFKEFYRILKPGGMIIVSNINKGFSPNKIFIDHLKQSFKKNGVGATLSDFLSFSSGIIKIFYYNYLIKKENGSGNYDFMAADDQINLLERAGFKINGKTLTTYAGQAYLDSAVKPKV